MALFSRRRRDGDVPSARQAQAATVAYLREFTGTRVGVEAYVEPATPVTPTTVMLVAADGEWTRRKVPDPAAAYDLARTLGIPCYDVQRTGYPQRVRDHNARRRIERQRARQTGR